MESSSAYKLKIEALDSYMHAFIGGGSSFILDELVEVLHTIAIFCHEHGEIKVLIKDRISFGWGA